MRMIFGLFAAVAVLAATPSAAARFRFSAAGVFNADDPSLMPYIAPGATWSFSFIVDDSAPPLIVEPFAYGATISEASYLVNGIDALGPNAFVGVFGVGAAEPGPGIDFYINFEPMTPSFGFTVATGVSPFSGSPADPQLIPGVYAGQFFAFPNGATRQQPDNFLTITAVPEPATWGLMILGFGLVGSVLRSRVAQAVA